MKREGGYRCARKLREVPSDRLLVETAEFAGVNGESVGLGLLEAIHDGDRVGKVCGPCEVNYLCVSAEWREEGKVRENKLAAGDMQGLAETHASTTNPCLGHQG